MPERLSVERRREVELVLGLLFEPVPPEIQQQVLDAYERDMQKLEAEVARLRTALDAVQPWIEHKIGCASWPSPFDGEVEPCDCGLAGALRSVDGATTARLGGDTPGGSAQSRSGWALGCASGRHANTGRCGCKAPEGEDGG